MNKAETVALYNKLFTKKARTLGNWIDLVESLGKDGELTPRQVHKFIYILDRKHIVNAFYKLGH